MQPSTVNFYSGKTWRLKGELVSFPSRPRHRRLDVRQLDGFLCEPPKRTASADAMAVFVHGMGSNFYRSRLKKACLEIFPQCGIPVLSFNNRGAEQGTEDEPFLDCLDDLDGALHFGRQLGYRRFLFIGHSTGCQKIAFWQARRQKRHVALALLAPADDRAILQSSLGRRFEAKVEWAHRMCRDGKGGRLVSGLYERFTAARFLSAADSRHIEANVFHYPGALTQFRRLTCPVLAVFGAAEEFAPIPPPEMLDILSRKTRSKQFQSLLIPDAGHSFKEHEAETIRAVRVWFSGVKA